MQSSLFRFHRRTSVGALCAALFLGLSGCAGRVPQPAGAPVPDPAALAADLQRATVPPSPRQVTFTWTLDEAGTRLRGRGVARYVAPDRLRLDLFGPRGETYLAAALVGDEFRLPPAAAEAISLPSPSLLWAALGVLRPPTGAEVERAIATDSTAALRYQAEGGEVFEFRFATAPGSATLQRVERAGRSGVLETVQLHYSDEAELTRAEYRNWAAYRDLVLETESVTDASSFPEDIWSPGRAPR